MQVIVKARHMNLTDSLRAHASEKLGNSVIRVFDRPAAKIEIELSELAVKDGADKECRVTVFVPRGKAITITEIGDDMYTAIDLAHDRLLMTVKRERDRRGNIHQRRRAAERERLQIMREELTAGSEPWELELAEYEGQGTTGLWT